MRIRHLIPAILAGIVAISCATAPQVPQWVLAPPPPDGSNTFFTGSATGPDLAAATGDATANLIANIMQYIGVTVKVNTSATAKASMDAYAADIRQTVETQSSNRLAGFKVVQKYVQTDKSTGRQTVHILASYQTSELNKEKARIAALFQEKVDAVAKPEAEGDALAGQGRILEAVDRYLQAMVAASGSDIENAEIKLERNANKARDQLASLGFVMPGGTEFRASLGRAPSVAVEFQLVAGKGGVRRPVPGAALSISYPRKLANGKLGTRTDSVVTDSNGFARLMLPPPDFVGKGRITAQLDLSSALELLDKVPKKFDAYLSAIEDEISSKMASVNYTVASQAASLPTAFFVVDLDDAGRATTQGATQSGVMETLTKEGFQLRVLALDPSAILVPADQVIALARSAATPGTVRLAFGTAKILSVRKDGSMFIASASGSVKVVDLATGQVLYSADKSWQAVASDEGTARRNALKELGSQVFGKDLAATLP